MPILGFTLFFEFDDEENEDGGFREACELDGILEWDAVAVGVDVDVVGVDEPLDCIEGGLGWSA